MTPPSNVARMEISSTASDIDPKSGLVESEFLKKFREKFVGTGLPKPWPRVTVNTPTEYANEFVAVFRSMFMLLEDDEVPPEGPPNSAKQMIKELIAETEWPTGESIPVPDPWKLTRVRAFRRYEISACIAILMQAYKGGPGGDPSGYPPQRPS